MQHRRRWATVYRWLTRLQWGVGVVLALLGPLLKADSAQVRYWVPWAENLVVFVQSWAWLAIPCLMAAVGLAQLLRKMIGPPWIWDVVHSLLDELQVRAFGANPESPLHHHRATLFRHTRWRWAWCKSPWTGWLVAVERSGHATRRQGVAFRAPDDADLAEGVAGQTWACNGVIFKDNLPDLSRRPSNTKLSKYAEEAWVTEEWLRKKGCLARSFCGIPVEVGGRLWGVIVLDSRDAKPIPRETIDYFEQIVRQLGALLRKV